MSMKTVNVRVPDELLAAVEKKGALVGLSPGQYARRLMEQDTGVVVDIKIGIAAAEPKTRARVEKARLKGLKNRGKPKGDSANGK